MTDSQYLIPFITNTKPITGSILSRLFSEIKNDIVRVRSARPLASEEYALKVTNRALCLLTLNVILHEYRQRFANIFNPLNGDGAFTNLILNKHHWHISVIEDLSLKDALLSINDEFYFERLPSYLQDYLTQLNYQKFNLSFDDYLYDEWDPIMGQRALMQIVE